MYCMNVKLVRQDDVRTKAYTWVFSSLLAIRFYEDNLKGKQGKHKCIRLVYVLLVKYMYNLLRGQLYI